MRDELKKFIGLRLMRLGIQWTNSKVYTIPGRSGTTDVSTMDLTKCQCGHPMHDHLPDPDGHGTICLSCFAKMRHRPVHADALEASLIGDYEEL